MPMTPAWGARCAAARSPHQRSPISCVGPSNVMHCAMSYVDSRGKHSSLQCRRPCAGRPTSRRAAGVSSREDRRCGGSRTAGRRPPRGRAQACRCSLGCSRATPAGSSAGSARGHTRVARVSRCGLCRASRPRRGARRSPSGRPVPAAGQTDGLFSLAPTAHCVVEGGVGPPVVAVRRV